MGRDKALLPLTGKPLIEYALTALHHAGIMAAIVGDRPDLAHYGPIVPDQETGRGPLQGVCRALASTNAECAIVLSVDTPLLPASLLKYLVLHGALTQSHVTIPSVNGFPQTFPCVLRREALAVLEGELRVGNAGCFAAFRAAARNASQPVATLPVELLAQTGHVRHPAGLPTAAWFLNVNTPEDLAAAGRWLNARSRNLESEDGRHNRKSGIAERR
jgi:molybdopterin-guanine dinucleotide biosynthesis protein A